MGTDARVTVAREAPEGLGLRALVDRVIDRPASRRQQAPARVATEEALHASLAHLRAVLSSAPVVLCVIDRGAVIAGCEGAALDGLGGEAGFAGRLVFDAFAGRATFLAAVIGALAGTEGTATLELRDRVFETRSVPLYDRAGEIVGAASVWIDATERTSAQQRLAELTAELDAARSARADRPSATAKHESCLYESAFSQTAEGIAITSREFGPSGPMIVLANEAFAHMTGYEAHELIGRPLGLLGGTRASGSLKRAGEQLAQDLAFSDEVIAYRKDGTQFPAEWEITPVRDEHGELRSCLLVQRDISERKRAQAEAQHRALHDGLTDLPNRTLLQNRLEDAIHVARRTGAPFCLALLDLDNFKDVNDAFGHEAGDALLRQVAVRLRETLRETDTIARLGGDEFAIVLPDTDLEGAIGIVRKLLEVLDRPFAVLSQELDSQASVGIAAYPPEGTQAQELLRRADVALYLAKRARGGYAVYSLEDDEHNPDRLLLMSELRRAIDRGELVVHYQPQVSFATREVVGMEALVRWEHPRRGSVPPNVFIPLAERGGLIKPLYNWVLATALRQCRAWSDSWERAAVAVNTAMPNLMDPRCPTIVASALRESGVEPQRLRIEVTESTIMADPERARGIVAELRAMGVQISIDDFGTGHSSLAYIQRLAANEIKIDKSFVIGVAEDRNRAAIVRATVDLGQDFGLQVVAEGIEDQRSWDVLFACGCDVAQGYHVSPPLPADEAIRSLVDRGWVKLGTGRHMTPLLSPSFRSEAPPGSLLNAPTQPEVQPAAPKPASRRATTRRTPKKAEE